VKWPWISRRKHEELLVADREWAAMSARTHFTFAMRESAREGYKVGLEEGLRRRDGTQPDNVLARELRQ
jgi:hypothetical protein